MDYECTNRTDWNRCKYRKPSQGRSIGCECSICRPIRGRPQGRPMKTKCIECKKEFVVDTGPFVISLVCPACQGRYQPAQIKTPFKLSRPNKNKYLKLYNGDIYDVDSNMILDRQALKALLDG